MLKRFLIIFATFLAALTITGCIQNEPESTAPAESVTSYHLDDISQHSENMYDKTESYETNGHDDSYFVGCFPSGMRFFSIEEFLYAYVSVRDGKASDDLARGAINSDFASLDEIYLLTNLPKVFQITKITVCDDVINFVYAAIGEEDTQEARNNAMFNDNRIDLQVTRWTYEDLESWGINSPLDGIMRQDGQRGGFTEEELIDGKYYFSESPSSYWLSWAQGSNRFTLRISKVAQLDYNASEFGATDIVTESSIRDMIRFAETVAVDLRDENNITALSTGDFSMIEGLLQSENITIAEPPDEYHAEDISQHNEISYDETKIYEHEPLEQDDLYVFPMPEELLESESVTTSEF